ncbi:MAG: hypothetical protein OEV64_13345, partial [Desulfobulbaceae bacterium]|nr:hypothetical protein [Desulfobulbaceae bacterium]
MGREIKLEARAFASDYRAHINVRVMSKGENGRIFYAKPIELTEVEPGLLYPESFILSINAAQLLMDDLWTAGIRPT